MRTKTIHLGMAPVDSGQLLIVDPAYLWGNEDDSDGDKYKEVCRSHTVGCTHEHDDRVATEQWGGVFHHGRGGATLVNDLGISLGVVTSTGLGDGVYPVTAEVVHSEVWGERVASVTIHFLDQEDDTE